MNAVPLNGGLRIVGLLKCILNLVFEDKRKLNLGFIEILNRINDGIKTSGN